MNDAQDDAKDAASPGDAPGSRLPAVELGLRVELARLVTVAGSRRAITPVCHVGRPGGEQARIGPRGVRDAALDAGLRSDLVVRALDGIESTDLACAWVTRSGPLSPPTDDDAAWYAAALTGFGRHGVDLTGFWVLNRTGWRDHVRGTTRTWSRIRPLKR